MLVTPAAITSVLTTFTPAVAILSSYGLTTGVGANIPNNMLPPH